MSYADPAKAPSDETGKPQNPGLITSDSLAAESYNAGGGFEHPPQSVPSRATTSNTTDTSGASILPAAVDATSRPDAPEDATYSTPGDALDGNSAEGTSAPYNTTKGYVDPDSVGTAPSYVHSAGSAGGLPKGENLTEGGFDGDAPNRSFNTEIGSRNDPGLLAERETDKANARSAADAGYEGDEALQGGKGGFENLNSEEGA